MPPTPTASVARILDVQLAPTLGILDASSPARSSTLSRACHTVLGCNDNNPLADILCIDLGIVKELSTAELQERNLDFGEGTVGREATAATIRVLPIPPTPWAATSSACASATSTAAANATPAVPATTAPPIPQKLPKTGGGPLAPAGPRAVRSVPLAPPPWSVRPHPHGLSSRLASEHRRPRLTSRSAGPPVRSPSAMAPLIATACIVLLVAALSVYGPVVRHPPTAALHADGFGYDEPVPVPAAAGGNDPISKLVGVLRTRPWARMLLTTVSIGLLVGAVGTIGYPFYTNLLQDRIQARLDRQIASDGAQAGLPRPQRVRSATPSPGSRSPTSTSTSSSSRAPPPARCGPAPGTTRTRRCPARSATSPSPATAPPTAARSTTWTCSRWATTITLETPIGELHLRGHARSPSWSRPSRSTSSPTRPNRATLTLTTCHPKGSAKQRLVHQGRAGEQQP